MANTNVSVNTGVADRVIRLVLGVALVLWPTLAAWETWTTTVLAAVGGALIIMALTGHCGLYRLIGISTARSKSVTTTTRSTRL